MIERGYALHASAIAASSIDCAVGLQYWCESDERAARWRKHERVGGLPFKTGEILPAFADSVCGAIDAQHRSGWTATRLHGRWKFDYAMASMVKHGNPFALRRDRVSPTEDGRETVHSGPSSGADRLARASADLRIAEEMFFAAVVAAGHLLQCAVPRSYQKSLLDCLNTDAREPAETGESGDGNA
jgi:hypothetical protein